MKRMLLGMMLFFAGFIGILTIKCISIFRPWDYNGIVGLHGFLLGTNTMFVFVLSCIICVIGLIICAIEYFRKTV